MSTTTNFLLVGHGCLDMTLPLPSSTSSVLSPGTLISTSPALFSIGGCVPNTGAALRILGNTAVQGVFAVAEDEFGSIFLRLLEEIAGKEFFSESCVLFSRHGPHAEKESVLGDSPKRILEVSIPISNEKEEEKKKYATSYSIILSPQQGDRTIFHCAGVNNQFSSHHIPVAVRTRLSSTHVVHVGYPPLLKAFCLDNNARDIISFLVDATKNHNCTVSLDMTSPDTALLVQSERVDWVAFLQSVLPLVHLFTPSIEEIQSCFADRFDDEDIDDVDDGDITMIKKKKRTFPSLLRKAVHIANVLISMGVPMVLIKLGAKGLLLRTAPHLSTMGRGFDIRNKNHDISEVEHLTRNHTKLEAWSNISLFAPVFEVDCVGTTGAGDCTVAMFLSCIAADETFCSIATSGDSSSPLWLCPSQTLMLCSAAGACNVEAHNSTSGMMTIGKITERVGNGWRRRVSSFFPEGEKPDAFGNFVVSP